MDYAQICNASIAKCQKLQEIFSKIEEALQEMDNEDGWGETQLDGLIQLSQDLNSTIDDVVKDETFMTLHVNNNATKVVFENLFGEINNVSKAIEDAIQDIVAQEEGSLVFKATFGALGGLLLALLVIAGVVLTAKMRRTRRTRAQPSAESANDHPESGPGGGYDNAVVPAFGSATTGSSSSSSTGRSIVTPSVGRRDSSRSSSSSSSSSSAFVSESECSDFYFVSPIPRVQLGLLGRNEGRTHTPETVDSRLMGDVVIPRVHV
ncbi:uncharacterized protein LOC135213430 [Macrobrachium nipponense]|uniref:uncharacterized protein LOC135213430 n=1 Tax=Macrobrachium nipponense TaxID=159736 RepID=UPI0030C8A2C9